MNKADKNRTSGIPVGEQHCLWGMLKDRCVLITGGTRGIGLSIARACLSSGAKVAITGRDALRVNAAVHQLQSELDQDSKAGIFGMTLEMKDVDSFAEKYDECKKLLGRVDALVNNAGLLNFKRFGNVAQGDFDSVIDTNLRGTYFLSQTFAARWIKDELTGNILNVCSSSSLRPARSPYEISKWGLRALTAGLGRILAPHGIVVNGIAPGPTAKENQFQEYSFCPAGRMVTEAEIANLAVVLLSSLGRMIVGDVVYATGGAGNLTYDDCLFNFSQEEK